MGLVGLSEGCEGLSEWPKGRPEGPEGLPGGRGWGTDGWTNGISPHFTELCPLLGPLPKKGSNEFKFEQ